jgi:general stress protein YciG
MGGTHSGGIKARDTNKAKYGKSFYARIGAIGGSKSGTGGFYADRELARRAGKLGGTISRRGKAKAPIVDIEPPRRSWAWRPW